MTDLKLRSWATFREDGIYRYSLSREWEKGKGTINFLCLNPSTADEQANDPTVERCQRRAIMWGYKRLVVTNIYAYRSTDPLQLRKYPQPRGPENNDYILREAKAADVICCAWGNHGTLNRRAREVKTMLRLAGVELHVLRLSRRGIPCHPLYLPYSEGLKLWP